MKVPDLANPTEMGMFLKWWSSEPQATWWRDTARQCVEAMRATTDSASTLVREHFARLAKARDEIDWGGHPFVILVNIEELHERYRFALETEVVIRSLSTKDMIVEAASREPDPGKRKYYARVVARVEREFGFTFSVETARKHLGRKAPTK